MKKEGGRPKGGEREREGREHLQPLSLASQPVFERGRIYETFKKT